MCFLFLLLESPDLCVTIQAGTGRFELCLNNKIVLSGNIFVFDHLKFKKNLTTSRENDDDNLAVSFHHDEVYSIFEQFGYCVGDSYKTTKRVEIFQDSTHTYYTRSLTRLYTLYNFPLMPEPC